MENTFKVLVMPNFPILDHINFPNNDVYTYRQAIYKVKGKGEK